MCRESQVEEQPVLSNNESLSFYLIVTLPSIPHLTRFQATSLLIPSSQASPHLTLAADLSYVDSTPTPRPPIDTNVADPLNRREGVTRDPSTRDYRPQGRVDSSGVGLGLGRESAPKVHLPSLPSPSTRPDDAPWMDCQGIPVWNYNFVPLVERAQSEDGRNQESANANSKGKAKEVKFGGGRVWVGRKGGDQGTGSWIGVWEFEGDVSFVRSEFTSPKACLTITMTFRDDPRLADLLIKCATPGAPVADSDPEDDEYLVESFDDVNLLDGLEDEYDLHLPASRLPFDDDAFPPEAVSHRRSSSVSSIHRRESINTHRRSLSLAGPSSDALLYPSVRRAFRRILSVKSALTVRMRTVPCPVSGFGRTANRTTRRKWDDVMLEENEGMGMAMCVEVTGCGQVGDNMGFEIEGIEVDITGGAGPGDVEVKFLDVDGQAPEFPIVLNPADQHNFLYALSYSGQEDHSTSLDALPPPVPIHVATSPSQRFSAMMGDFQESVDQEGPPLPLKQDPSWARNVGIIVRGRPVKLPGRKTSDSSRSLTAGAYDVPGSLNASEPTEVTASSPTKTFDSRWNCNLDISTFALPIQSKQASFRPSTIIPAHLQTFVPAPRNSLNSSTFVSRPDRNSDTLEAIAGSKRFTIANLTTLANKSPTISRRKLRLASFAPRSSVEAPRSRSSTPAPYDVPTPGATGPPKRFSSQGPLAISPRLSTYGDPPPPFKRSSTPSYPPLSAARPHFPVLDGMRRPSSRTSMSENRRDSWAPVPSAYSMHQAKIALPEEPRMPPETGFGLGLVGTANVGTSSRMETGRTNHGSILVSVALVPLRAFRSTAAFEQDSEAEEVDGTERRGRTFAFPPMSPTSPSPTATSTADVNLQQGLSRMPVGLLDVFLVEVFIINKSDLVKRFTVGVPARRSESTKDPRIATIVPLENDVRIGPMAPQTCASVRLRFLAIRPGAHTLQELRLVDMSNGYEVRLRTPMQVQVENR
ncbi:hypothetical protein P7C70_g87, partial [Phenoliferia sp. Uapishka_3]